jgi:hypothetical protein
MMHGHDMKYSQCSTGCKGNRLTPANLEPEVIKEVSILGKRSSSTVVRCPLKQMCFIIYT